MNDRRQRVAFACVLASLVFLLGVWPWLPLVELYPHGSDATKWVQESHPSTRGWLRYVFFTRHFIGYRPVAALTYTLNGFVSGWEPWAYRLTDIGLHASVAVLLLFVYRALTSDRSAWGLLAPLVFLLHPATEDVVPHLARRSYSLSCALTLAGMLAFIGAARDPHRPFSRKTWLATGLFLLALTSNEVAGVALVLLPLLALHLRPPGSPPWWRSLLLVAPVYVATAALLLMRFRILGYTGGYHKRYFAYVANGHQMLREVNDAPYGQILEAAWRYALFPSSASGQEALLLGGVFGVTIALGVGLFYGWQTLIRPAAAWKDSERRLPGLLFVWLLGYTLLYALSRNWFWRMGYPMLLPLSLIVAVLARDTAHRTGWRRWALALPQVTLLVSLAWHAPALWGIDTNALRAEQKMSASITDVASVLEAEDLRGPAVVYLAVPTRAGNAHMVRIWSDLLAGNRRIVFKVLAISQATAAIEMDDPLLNHVSRDGRPFLTLPPGMEWSDVAMSQHKLAEGAPLPLDVLYSRGVRTWVYFRDGARGQLVEAGPPVSMPVGHR